MCAMQDSTPAEQEACARFMVTSSSAPYRKVACELCSTLQAPHKSTVRHGKEAIHGTASFTAPVTVVRSLANLTLPERVYVVICNVPAAKLHTGSVESLQAQLETLTAEAAGWSAALAAHQIVHPALAPPSIRFAVSAKRRGKLFKQLINDFALARHIGSAIHERFGWAVDLTHPNLEVSASLNDDGLLLALTLLRRSDSMDCRWPFAGLDPQVAWAMVRSAGVLPPRAVVCDPMAGRSSLLFEALAAHHTCLAIGLDADAEQLAKSEANRRAAPRGIGQRLSLIHADAMAVPLPDRCCDALLCDLPFESNCPRFGHKIDTSRGASLESIVHEFARLLIGHGSRAVLLLNEARMPALRAALQAGVYPQSGAAAEGEGAGDELASRVDSRRRFRILCERPCPLGFTQAVIVVAELRDDADNERLDVARSEPHVISQQVQEDGDVDDELQPLDEAKCQARSAPPSSLPWEEVNLRRADWAALRLQRRAPMLPWCTDI